MHFDSHIFIETFDFESSRGYSKVRRDENF